MDSFLSWACLFFGCAYLVYFLVFPLFLFPLFQPIRSPLTPNVLITGIVPSESSIFKSALHPLRLTFRTANGGTCKMIFKKGDDLRQDQLVGASKTILHEIYCLLHLKAIA